MKPFDLKAALAGAKVITRDGREVFSVRHYPDNPVWRTVLADVRGEDGVIINLDYYSNGRYRSVREDVEDLFMAEEEEKIKTTNRT